MTNHLRVPKFWAIATIQTAITVAAVATWFYFRTEAYLAGPPDPDTYAWNWGFQLVVFLLLWLPATLLVTSAMLAIERILLAPFYRSDALNTKDTRGA